MNMPPERLVTKCWRSLKSLLDVALAAIPGATDHHSLDGKSSSISGDSMPEAHRSSLLPRCPPYPPPRRAITALTTPNTIKQNDLINHLESQGEKLKDVRTERLTTKGGGHWNPLWR